MTPGLTPDARRQVEEYVGRSLTADELTTAISVNDLSDTQRAIVEMTARRHRLVALMYLRGIVDELLTSEALRIIDHIRDTPRPR